MNYYQRLKDLREDRDLKQEDIANLLGIKQTQYSRYELGKNAMNIKRYITLAKFYNVSLDYLAGLSDEPKTIDGKPILATKTISGNTTTITGNGNKIHIKN